MLLHMARACRWISAKDPVIHGYYPKAGTTPKVPTSPTSPTESRSSLISDLPTVLICSLSGTEESNCSLCGLNEMYLQLLGALFQNVPCYFSSRTSFYLFFYITFYFITEAQDLTS